MYWWERERFRRQETQISRKKGLVLLPREQFVESRLARTSDRDYVGSTPPSMCGRSSSPAVGALTTRLLSCGRQEFTALPDLVLSCAHISLPNHLWLGPVS